MAKSSGLNLRRTYPFFFAVTVLSLPGIAMSAPAEPLDRINLSVGAYFSKVESNAAITAFGNRFQTAPFDLTDGSDAVGRARLALLLGEKQGLEFDFYRFRPSNSKSVDQSYRVGGTDYLLNASVSGRARFDIGGTTYRWWLGDGPTVVGLGFGAAYYGVRFDVSGSASLGGSSTSGGDSFSDHAVAPMLAAGLRHSLEKNMRVYVDGTAVRKNSGSLNGHIYNAAVGFEWYPLHNIGVGGEYGISRISLDKQGGEFAGELNFNLQGPSLFLKARFLRPPSVCDISG